MNVYDGSQTFRAIDFIQDGASLRGVAVGSSGTMMLSDNGGTTWRTSILKSTPTLYSVTFANADEVYAVGEIDDHPYFLRSADSGAHWSSLDFSSLPNGFRDIHFLNSSTGAAVGTSGLIMRTSTGGETTENWLRRSLSSPTTETLNAVYFDRVDESRVWVVGTSGMVARSLDAGIIWTYGDSGTTAPLYDVQFANAAFGLAVGSGGKIIRSFDGGMTWRSCTSGTMNTLYSVVMLDMNNAWVVGSTGTILRTTNAAGSCTWELVSSGTTTTLRGSTFVNAHTGWAVGSGGEILRFDDEAPSSPTGVARSGDAEDTTPGFSWNASTDNVAVHHYSVSFDGTTFTDIGNVLSYTPAAPLAAGAYTFRLRAVDAAGNISIATLFPFEVAADTTPPGMPVDLTRTSVISDPTPTFVWGAPVDAGGVVGYQARMAATDSSIGEVFPLADIGNVLTYTLPVELALSETPATTYVFFVRAIDAAGNASPEAYASFSSPFGDEDEETVVPPADEPATPAGLLPTGFSIGDLVKLPDDGNVETFGDSAVFYLGADGNRYVFPNDKTYFTWYSNFSTVRTISVIDMAAIPLRGNVTYHPGIKMVKLQTNPTVYVVARGGVLHAVPSETVAAGLYGADWNTKIDDVNDAFWFNYSVADALEDVSDFSPAGAQASAATINIDLGLSVPVP